MVEGLPWGMRGSSHTLGAPGLVSNTGNARRAAGTKGGLWEAWIPLMRSTRQGGEVDRVLLQLLPSSLRPVQYGTQPEQSKHSNPTYSRQSSAKSEGCNDQRKDVKKRELLHRSVQFTQSCPTLCDPMNRSMPGLPVHHQLPEFTQTHVHRVSDAIQPSHPLLSPSPPAPNPSQHQSLFQ